MSDSEQSQWLLTVQRAALEARHQEIRDHQSMFCPVTGRTAGSGSQGYLFAIVPRDVARQIGLNWASALWLHERGFLSYDPAAKPDLTVEEETELVFLGELVVAGCDEGMLNRLLAELERPYCLKHSDVYFDWRAECWLRFPAPEAESEEEMDADSHIEWLRELEDLDGLKRLRDEIDAAIEGLRFDGEKPAEGTADS